MDVEATRTEDAGRRHPFEPHHLDLPGGRMHYVDEGRGRPVVLVHGTPTSSFLYRHLIPPLAETHRVVAPDHLGFGRSDKPPDADYRPEAHARNLQRFFEELDLREVVLAVHDFGGPIGLSFALRHPERVRGLVLFNTWMWSLEGTPAGRISRLLSGRVGRFLYTRLNLSPRLLLKAGFADTSKLTREAHRHYIEAFPTPSERVAPWVFARELVGSGAWYEGLWAQRDRLRTKPALLLWGMKDPAFGPDFLARWRRALPRARVETFPDAGHFVQEEAPKAAVGHLRSFLEELDRPG